MSRVLNKMVIVSGGVKPTDTLGEYRFLNKKLLNQIFWGYVSPCNDCGIEVDTTGMHIEYDKYHCDNYFTCNGRGENVKLKKCTAVKAIAKINGAWQYIDCSPYSDIDEYLRKQGYERKLGYGAGWYDTTHKPSFKDAVYTFFNGTHHGRLEYDFAEYRFAGIIADMKQDKLIIHSGKESNWYDKIIGELYVENDEVVVKLHDDVMRFRTETDPDFIKFATMCIESQYIDRGLFNEKHATDKATVDKIMTHIKDTCGKYMAEDVNYLVEDFMHLIEPYIDALTKTK